jgi:D-alanyl-lipoteichoic acid acyltransferase DltB (MBOAT superfamily)
MVFNSLTFWIFFPVFFGLYFILRGNARLWLCLSGSYLFYGWWDWRFLGLIALLTGINFWCGLKIADSNPGCDRRKHYVRFSVVCSLAILGFFKYFNFFIQGFSDISSIAGLQFNVSTMAIILPVGISFYTFQTMSYTIDLYRNEVCAERSLLKFSVFVSFFPQLVAGPIVRAKDFLPQLQSDRTVRWEDLRCGMNQVLWGIVLKVVLADNLAFIADSAFSEPVVRSGLFLLIGVLFYAFQIYGDFAGYSLIAIGLARMLGFHFLQNFDRPYFATSFSEFWQRWHISLSSWLRDYLYIPLGGNRTGRVRTQINLMLTMLLGGLWHGAAWGFVAWGALHGLYLILQRWLVPVGRLLPLNSKVLKIAQGLTVFGLVCLGWVFFRAENVNEALLMLHKIMMFEGFALSTVIKKFYVVIGISIISMIFLIEALSFRIDYNAWAKKSIWINGLFDCYCLVLIAFLGSFGGGAFIYFQF